MGVGSLVLFSAVELQCKLWLAEMLVIHKGLGSPKKYDGGGEMVKVIIERHCRGNKIVELGKVLTDLRIEAMRQHGYISGETLRAVDDPSLVLVTSTWAGADHWERWEASSERREIARKIAALLVAPEKVTVFNFISRGGAESAHTVQLADVIAKA